MFRKKTALVFATTVSTTSQFLIMLAHILWIKYYLLHIFQPSTCQVLLFNPTVIFWPPIKLSFCTMGVGNNHINWREYPSPCPTPGLDPLLIFHNSHTVDSSQCLASSKTLQHHTPKHGTHDRLYNTNSLLITTFSSTSLRELSKDFLI